jgi:uncharacterized protein YaiL (DUF2058 family)
MGDMRDALRKAGLASEKEVRQAKHRDRVRRTELGEEGLARERAAREAAQAAERTHKKQEDRAREAAQKEARDREERRQRLATLLQENDLMGREGGPRRFYFVTPERTISFLAVSPQLARRLAQGDAAVVAAAPELHADFAVISGKAAHELSAIDPERILFWNARH